MRIVSECSGSRTCGPWNRIPWGFWLFLATGCALWPGASIAGDTMRCGSYLVSVGDPGYEVEARCGRPSYRYFTEYGDIWVYNFGPSRFLEQLRFLNGRLVDISSHGYGFSAPSQGQSPANYPPPPYDGSSPYPTPYQYEGPLYPLYAPFRHAQQRNERREHRERMREERRETQHRKQDEKGRKRRTGERHERRPEPDNERKGLPKPTVP